VTDGQDPEPQSPGPAPRPGSDQARPTPLETGDLSDPARGRSILAPVPQPDPVGAAPDRPAPTPSAIGPLDFLGGVVTGAVGGVGLILQPEAALAVATEFTFPLSLAIAVLLYLVVQDQVDRRDPKLRSAPRHQTDTLIAFEPEEQP
jgi:hypothetical protein